MNWLYLLLGIVIGIIFIFLFEVISWFIGVYRNRGKELFCNDCERGYPFDLDFKYCPICSKKLTYHRANPLYDPIINSKEIGLERPNNIESDDSNNEE